MTDRETHPDRSLTRQLAGRCLVALLVIGALALAGVVLRHRITVAHEEGARLVDASGRQRMRSVRVALLAEALGRQGEASQAKAVRKELRHTVERLSETHRGLLDGLPARDLPGDPPPAVRRIYHGERHALDAKMTAFLSDARALLEHSAGEVGPDHRAVTRVVDRVRSGSLLDTLDALVGAFERHYESQVDRLRTWNWATFGLLVASLLLTWFFAFRPMVGHVREYLTAVRDKEEQLRAIVENAADPILTVDEGGTVRSFNPAAERTFGYPASEVSGRPVTALVPDGLDAAAGRDGAVGRRKNGAPFPLEGTVGRYQRAGRTRFTAVLRDITARREAEEALRRERAFAESLIDAVQAMIVVLDGSGRVLRLNPYSAELLGFAGEDAVGADWATTFVPRRERSRARSFLEESVRDQGVTGMVTAVTGARGEEREIRWASRLIRAGPDEPVRVVAVGHDLTERKALEKQILDASARERRRVSQQLHEGLGQSLAGAAFLASTLRNRLSCDEAETAGQVETHLNSSVEQLRGVVKGLSPVEVDPEGLMFALWELTQSVQRTFGIPCEMQGDRSVHVEDHDSATHLYDIAHEAVHHAVERGSTRIRVGLHEDAPHGVLWVELDGAAPEAEGEESDAARLMHYRSRMIGGSLELRPGEEGGTVVTCRFPKELIASAESARS